MKSNLILILILIIFISSSFSNSLNLDLNLTEIYDKFLFETPYCKPFYLYLDKCDNDICGGGCGMVTKNSNDTNIYYFNVYQDAECGSIDGIAKFQCNSDGSPVIISPFKIYCKSANLNTITKSIQLNK